MPKTPPSEVKQEEHPHFLKDIDAINSSSSPLTWLIAEAISYYIFHNYGANREEDFDVEIPQAKNLFYQVSSFPKTTAIARKSVTAGPLIGEYVHSHAHLSRIRKLEENPKACPELMSKYIPLPDDFTETTKDLSLYELIELINSKRVHIKSIEIEKGVVTFVDDKWNKKLQDCKDAMKGEYQISFSINFNGKVSENEFRNAFIKHKPTVFQDPAKATQDPKLLQLYKLLEDKKQTHCGFPVHLHTTIDDKYSKKNSGPLQVMQRGNLILRSDIDICLVSLPLDKDWPGASEIYNIAKSYPPTFHKNVDGTIVQNDVHISKRKIEIKKLQSALKKMLRRGLDEKPMDYGKQEDRRKETSENTAFRLHIFSEFVNFLDPNNSAKDLKPDFKFDFYAEKIYAQFSDGTYTGEGSAILVLQSAIRNFLNYTFVREKLRSDLVKAINKINGDNGKGLQRATALHCHQADANFDPQEKTNKVASEPPANEMGFVYRNTANVTNTKTKTLYTITEIANFSASKAKQFIMGLIRIVRLPLAHHTASFRAHYGNETGQKTAASGRYGVQKKEIKPHPPGTKSNHTDRARGFWSRRKVSIMKGSEEKPASKPPTSNSTLITPQVNRSSGDAYGRLADSTLLTSAKNRFAESKDKLQYAPQAEINIPGMVPASEHEASNKEENDKVPPLPTRNHSPALFEPDMLDKDGDEAGDGEEDDSSNNPS